MEDAMILNKASFERGFAHASVYKSEVSFPMVPFHIQAETVGLEVSIDMNYQQFSCTYMWLAHHQLLHSLYRREMKMVLSDAYILLTGSLAMLKAFSV